MKLSLVTPILLVLALAPLGCAVDGSAPVDGTEEGVGTDEGAATFPAGCVVASKFAPRGWDESLPVSARASGIHRQTGYAFGSVGVLDTRKSSLELWARGSGSFAGNSQLVSTSDYAICSGTITVARNARIWIGRGGLTSEQFASCQKNLDQKQCATLWHYCQPGTLTSSTCTLKNGVPVAATVYRR